MATTTAATLLLLFLVSITTTLAEQHEHRLLQSQGPAPVPRRGEKLSHLHFYWHDIHVGPSPTSVPIARASITSASPTSFGQVQAIDDPLTAEPSLSSKLLGRAQGLYAAVSKEAPDLIMAMNFAFIEGEFNGSSLTILGRNPTLDDVREMPIVGGNGLFRFARGYVHAHTVQFDPKTINTIVEYNVYVLHY